MSHFNLVSKDLILIKVTQNLLLSTFWKIVHTLTDLSIMRFVMVFMVFNDALPITILLFITVSHSVDSSTQASSVDDLEGCTTAETPGEGCTPAPPGESRPHQPPCYVLNPPVYSLEDPVMTRSSPPPPYDHQDHCDQHNIPTVCDTVQFSNPNSQAR